MGCGDGVLRYRSKRHAHTGRDYRAELVTEETVRSVKMLGLFGYLWANEVGALQSCLFCDDVFAELADATFMDAWLPDYDKDRRGTSLVISRSERLSQLLTVLFDTGAWEGGRIARERVVQSQRGLLQRRRKLLAARCQVASQTLAYVPTKRSGINPPPSSDADLAEAHREMTYFHKAREALLRFHHATARTSPRTTRWHAWRLCAKILLLAWRYGCLSKTLRGAAHLFRQKLSARVP
jgi:hypothetical protein